MRHVRYADVAALIARSSSPSEQAGACAKARPVAGFETSNVVDPEYSSPSIVIEKLFMSIPVTEVVGAPRRDKWSSTTFSALLKNSGVQHH